MRTRRPKGFAGIGLAAVSLRYCAMLVLALLSAALLGGFERAYSQDVADRLAPQATVQGARIAGDMDRTRLVLDFLGDVSPQMFVLPNPDRLIVDLPGVEFSDSASQTVSARGLAGAVRMGAFAPGQGRVVVDLAAPATVDEVLVLAALDDQPARLVIDLVSTDRDGFLAEIERTRSTFLASNEAPKSDRLDLEAPNRERPLIVLDPGHGGIDSGAVSRSGLNEKSVVLAYALQLAEQLRASGQYEVRMTRDSDTFIPLAGRVRFAQSAGADLFISIHADSLVRHPSLRGATVYTLSDEASDEIAQQLVENEARSELLAGMEVQETATSEVADILVELARRETTRFSLAFADVLVSEFSTAARMVTNPHRSAGFRVLKAPEIPSVLLELGFLSNAEDARVLMDSAWRERTIVALDRAIAQFFEQRLAFVP